MSTMPAPSDATGPAMGGPRGALVVSLDFELAWGVHDSLGSDGAYRANLLGARDAVPRILDLFDRYRIAATWATVGFLFAESRDELEAFQPSELPTYDDPRRDPYRIEVGASERDDPLHFAASLVREIAAAPRQEMGSHTYSHYYCLEPGQTVDQFEADLRSAVAIARARGIDLRSLVLPRHQVRVDYLQAIARAGFRAHRTNEANRLARPRAAGHVPQAVRAMRLLDSYLPITGSNAVPWGAAAPDDHGLVDVRESRFLRPVYSRLRTLETVRRARIAGAMRSAARSGQLFHVWWHPHNFGVRMEEHLASLRSLLDTYARLRDRYDFESLTMAQVAERAAVDASRTSRPPPWYP